MKAWILESLAHLGLSQERSNPAWAPLEDRLRAARPEPVIPASLHEGIMARLAERSGRRECGAPETQPHFPRLAYAGALALCVLVAAFGWATRSGEHSITERGAQQAASSQLSGAGELLAMPETLSAGAVAPLANELAMVQDDVRKAAAYVASALGPLAANGAEVQPLIDANQRE